MFWGFWPATLLLEISKSLEKPLSPVILYTAIYFSCFHAQVMLIWSLTGLMIKILKLICSKKGIFITKTILKFKVRHLNLSMNLQKFTYNIAMDFLFLLFCRHCSGTCWFLILYLHLLISRLHLMALFFSLK